MRLKGKVYSCSKMYIVVFKKSGNKMIGVTVLIDHVPTLEAKRLKKLCGEQ